MAQSGFQVIFWNFSPQNNNKMSNKNCCQVLTGAGAAGKKEMEFLLLLDGVFGALWQSPGFYFSAPASFFLSFFRQKATSQSLAKAALGFHLHFEVRCVRNKSAPYSISGGNPALRIQYWKCDTTFANIKVNLQSTSVN